MKLCEYCKKKKINLIPFSCKCLYKNLCMKCRLPSNHNCTYDFHTEWKQKLEKELPLIIGNKLERI